MANRLTIMLVFGFCVLSAYAENPFQSERPTNIDPQEAYETARSRAVAGGVLGLIGLSMRVSGLLIGSQGKLQGMNVMNFLGFTSEASGTILTLSSAGLTKRLDKKEYRNAWPLFLTGVGLNVVGRVLSRTDIGQGKLYFFDEEDDGFRYSGKVYFSVPQLILRVIASGLHAGNSFKSAHYASQRSKGSNYSLEFSPYLGKDGEYGARLFVAF